MSTGLFALEEANNFAIDAFMNERRSGSSQVAMPQQENQA